MPEIPFRPGDLLAHPASFVENLMAAKFRFILVAAGILIVLLGLLAVLQIHRFRQLLIEVESERISVVGLALKNDVERSLALGLPVRDNGQLGPMLERTLTQSAGLISLHLIDLDLDPGKILWQAGPGLTSPAAIAARQRRSPAAKWLDQNDSLGYLQVWPITDPIGRVVASLGIRFDRERAEALVHQAAVYVYLVLGALVALVLLVLSPVLLHSLARVDGFIAEARKILSGEPSSGEQHSEIDNAAIELVNAASALEKARH
ncbi:hypothetical protein BH11PSE11_BH11PSE11_22000 [soil metagenome]